MNLLLPDCGADRDVDTFMRYTVVSHTLKRIDTTTIKQKGLGCAYGHVLLHVYREIDDLGRYLSPCDFLSGLGRSIRRCCGSIVSFCGGF